MSQYVNVPKSDLDEGQIRELEQYEIAQGPLSVLQQSVRNHSQVLISLGIDMGKPARKVCMRMLLNNTQQR